MIDFTAQMSEGKARALKARNSGVGTNMPVFVTSRAQANAQGERDRDPVIQRGIEARFAYRAHVEMIKHEIDCRVNAVAYEAMARDFF